MAAVHALERARGEDHEGRDVAPVLAEELVVLERGVEVALAVEDGESDVAARREVSCQLVRPLDHDRIEVGLAEGVGHRAALIAGKRDRDRGTGHQ
jgi:hypothetical protein